MYKQGRAIRNKKGEIIKAADLQSTDIPNARVDPNRKWFGNTRVIAQDALTHFREAMGEKSKDSYQVLLKRNKLPMSLLDEKIQLNHQLLKLLKPNRIPQHLVLNNNVRNLESLLLVWKI